MATNVAVRRSAALVILLVLGVASLPVTAYFFDEQGTENWILPVAAVVMAVLGAVVGSLLPELAGRSASRRRGALVGAAVGISGLAVGAVVFFLLISGLRGA